MGKLEDPDLLVPLMLHNELLTNFKLIQERFNGSSVSVKCDKVSVFTAKAPNAGHLINMPPSVHYTIHYNISFHHALTLSYKSCCHLGW